MVFQAGNGGENFDKAIYRGTGLQKDSGAIVVGAGSSMALNGMATVGTIATFINYSRQFGRPLGAMANLYNTIQSAIAGAERVFQIIDEVKRGILMAYLNFPVKTYSKLKL